MITEGHEGRKHENRGQKFQGNTNYNRTKGQKGQNHEK